VEPASRGKVISIPVIPGVVAVLGGRLCDTSHENRSAPDSVEAEVRWGG